MYNCVEDKHVIRTYSPEYWEDEEFKARRYTLLGTLYREDPVPEPAGKYDIPAVRPKGWAIAGFEIEAEPEGRPLGNGRGEGNLGTAS